jgi:hypothetical protein
MKAQDNTLQFQEKIFVLVDTTRKSRRAGKYWTNPSARLV